MHKNRLEAFSDGVIAILITIMVLELKVPHGDSLDTLKPLLPVFLSYVLSFIYLAIYWNNHHHLLQITKHINGKVLWANTNLLFWLSLIPFVTGWSGENHFAAMPVALYGLVLFMCAISYYLLTLALLSCNGAQSELARAIGRDWKGKLSLLLYTIAIGCAYFIPSLALSIYVGVAVIWLIPDPRIEKAIPKS